MKIRLSSWVLALSASSIAVFNVYDRYFKPNLYLIEKYCLTDDSNIGYTLVECTGQIKKEDLGHLNLIRSVTKLD